MVEVRQGAGEETRRGEEKRGEEEEDEKREEKEDEDEEEATDIKSNNPHLAGGEKQLATPKVFQVYMLKYFVLSLISSVYSFGICHYLLICHNVVLVLF